MSPFVALSTVVPTVLRLKLPKLWKRLRPLSTPCVESIW
jgi:hypothetical protein